MTGAGDLLSEVVNDLIECFEMRNIFADKSFRTRIPPLLHEAE
jgi:hypothetical protein